MNNMIQSGKSIIMITLLLTGLFFYRNARGQETGKFTDERDKATYGWVKIGNVTWMSENLKYKTPQGSWAFNNDPSKVAIYGMLYTFDAAKTACPKGWYLPSIAEWTALVEGQGGLEEAGSKLKEKGTSHWLPPNSDANNSSGFTALPGGFQFYDLSGFKDLGKVGYFWSSSELDDTYAFYYCMTNDKWQAFKYAGYRGTAFSVRCIKNK
jgi:uncharacterized protein (TIGR02145 family)